MVWKILRPHYWTLDRKVRETNPAVVVVLILLLGYGGQWLYNNLIRDSLSLLNSEQAATAIASSLPFGLSLLLLFAMLGVGDVMHQLYLASDLELLMIAPLPYRTIFLVKLLQCSRATFIPALAFAGSLMALGLARGAAVSYYLLTVLLILAAILLTTAGVMMLVILLARWLPAQKTRSWMPAVLVLATSVLILGQQSATEWFAGQADLVAFLTEALLDPGQLGLLVASLGGLALAASLATYKAFDTSFHEGWNRFRDVPTRPTPRSLAARRRWGVSGLLRPLPQPFRSLLVKEWLALRRNPSGLINLAQPFVLVIMVLALFLGAGKGNEALQPLLFWFMLMFLVMFLSVLPVNGMPLMSIAQEGRKLALLRSAPVSMSAVLKGKFWATWVPLVVAWILVFLVAGMWLQFPWWQIGFLAGVTLWGLAGGSAMTMAIGGLRVDFSAEELKQRTSTVTSFLMMGLNLSFVLITTASLVWLMVRLFPDSRLVLVVQSLAGYAPVGWLFSDKLWIPLGLVGIQVLFWIGAGALWAAAVRRLEEWEGS
jgi:hypothetical protein